MNRTKLLTIAVLGLLLINLGTLIFILSKKSDSKPLLHQHPKGMRDEKQREEGPKQIIIERLNFDTLQQKKYEVFVEEHQSKSRELKDLSREIHDELYSLLKENTIDKSKSDSIINKISINQNLMDHLNFNHFQQIKSICNPEQLERFNALVEDLTHLFAPQGQPQGPPPH